MAKYLLLIYGDELAWQARSPQENQDNQAGHAAFAAAAGEAIIGGAELESTAAATTLRGRVNGRPTPTDGPFVETKEALGGYYLLEAPDLDAAIALAGKLPELATAHCAVEIRPIREAGAELAGS